MVSESNTNGLRLYAIEHFDCQRLKKCRSSIIDGLLFLVRIANPRGGNRECRS
jgi:hypothetical protein